jgi:type II secretory pathway pseudopilin PulG
MAPYPRIQLRTRQKGFTLFETIVAMFVVLMGLLGIIATFSVGMKARVMAQELLISQEVATMWADWVRFRLNDTNAGAPNRLTSADLKVGAGGDFYLDKNFGGASFHVSPGSKADLPTYQKPVYQGYQWEITAIRDGRGKAGAIYSYDPQWIPANVTDLTDNGGLLKDWNQRKDGAGVYPKTVGEPLKGLTDVELTVRHNGRSYTFNYTFSGVGLKY